MKDRYRRTDSMNEERKKEKRWKTASLLFIM